MKGGENVTVIAFFSKKKRQLIKGIAENLDKGRNVANLNGDPLKGLMYVEKAKKMTNELSLQAKNGVTEKEADFIQHAISATKNLEDYLKKVSKRNKVYRQLDKTKTTCFINKK